MADTTPTKNVGPKICACGSPLVKLRTGKPHEELDQHQAYVRGVIAGKNNLPLATQVVPGPFESKQGKSYAKKHVCYCGKSLLNFSDGQVATHEARDFHTAFMKGYDEGTGDFSVSREDVLRKAREWLAKKEDVPAILVAALDAMSIVENNEGVEDDDE